jgi:hypothetical protein
MTHSKECQIVDMIQCGLLVRNQDIEQFDDDICFKRAKHSIKIIPDGKTKLIFRLCNHHFEKMQYEHTHYNEIRQYMPEIDNEGNPFVEENVTNYGNKQSVIDVANEHDKKDYLPYRMIFRKNRL